MHDLKMPISARLALCASFVPEGAAVADVGTDHGYLAISLLRSGRARHVVAADLRSKPLETARRNADRFGVMQDIAFVLSDGLAAVDPESFDTLVMAGMGGDLMVRILQDAPWLRDPRYTLILQPQSAGQALRAFLAEQGFSIMREELVADGGFLYTVLLARFGGGAALSPGEQFVTSQLRASGSPLLGAYLSRIRASLDDTVRGIEQAKQPDDRKLAWYRQALAEVSEMEEDYVNCKEHS